MPRLTTLLASVANPSIAAGTFTQATASGRDQLGRPIALGGVTWTSANSAVARVDSGGVVTGLAPGTTSIFAASASLIGVTNVTVTVGARSRLRVLRLASAAFDNWPFGVQPQIEVTDALGNRVTTDNGTVVRAAATVGVIGSTLAATVNGVATFQGLGVQSPIGTAVSLSFVADGVSAASQSLSVAPFSFGNGTRLVSSEVRPGRYRSINGLNALCYWARLRNTTGTGDIIANDLGRGPRLLEVLPADVAVESSGCAPWVQITGPVTTSRTAPFSDGMYLVGVDIEPGTWRTPGSNALCYWARLRNINGSNDIIANNLNEGPAIMTVLPTDVAVDVSDCGTWTRVP
ncbi:Ig-like domain-containing protein [Gemmatimonas sp.]|uniref:Ig-like domain-containing protein n=1 Tax=Gemmatimonas sp. TaxID=1962908 RepID=UPI00391F3D99